MRLNSGVTLGVLTLVAFLIYASGLSSALSPLGGDEVALARQAYAIAQTGQDLDGRTLPLFVHSEGERWFTPLSAYSAVIAVALVPSSSVAVRWPSILFGILTLLLVYQLGLKLFQHPVLPLLAFGIALLTPALYHWSRLAVDGIFAVPFVLAAMLNVHLFLESQRSRHLWLTGLLLGIGFYSSTTAPIQMPIYLALFAVTLWIAGYKHAAVYGRLAAGFIAPLLLLVPWFALHPETYRDTLGRWAIHAAHVRNPLDGLRAMVNWGSLTNRASVYWEFLNPAFLFFPAESPDALRTTASGPLLATLMPLLLTGVVRVFRANSPALPLLVGGYFLAPLAAATFGEDHALERVLVMFPIAALLATFGVETMWGSRSKASQLTAALLLLLAALQFAFFLR